MEVEIWSDIACPWCYIGKRRFEAAMAQFEHADDVKVTWRSFELDPSAPAERPGDSATRLAEKYGMTVEEARAREQQVTEIAAGDGLDYHLEIARTGSTFEGHRLLQLAKQHGLQDQMKERLMRGRFTEGRLVADPEFLVSAAVEVGLDEREVSEMLDGDRFTEEVRADEQVAHRFGISGVPMFVVDRTYGASGAQPPEQLLALLRHGWENRESEPSSAASARAAGR
jgi:predicted DsbA family dithiol-disulfide isomerase